MFIKIVGKPKRNLEIPMIKKAALFFGEYLMGKRLANNINLVIEFKKFGKNNNDYAYCDWTYDNHRSRDFTVTIHSNLSKQDTIAALAHEMVHVKQYAKGEMKDIFHPVKMVKWQGVKYDADELDYWDQPWEIEAYGREKGLCYKFMHHLREEQTLIK